MARIDLLPHFNAFISSIAARNTYGGNPVSPSIMRMITAEIRADGGGVIAPYWLGVLERGRGKRKSNKDHGLVNIIYAWMNKRNMFKSHTDKCKWNEAKGMTWYINKYGNQQFRNHVFIDIYTTAREKTIADIQAEYSLAIHKITKDIL